MFELQPPEDDGLVKQPASPWSAKKHYYLRRYIDAFTTAMRRKKWTGLHYIDLFAGAGIEETDENRLDWGSPLIAAQSPIQFECLHLCEKNRRRYDALTKRLAKFPQPKPPQVVLGDANVVVHEIVKAVP